MVSPSGLALGGAGVVAGVVVGVPVVVSAGIGVALWGARVAVALPRALIPERIDPFALREPWRHYVRDALQAQARFTEAIGRTRPGPLHDRLDELAERIDTGVRECWRIAGHAQSLTGARKAIDVAAITAELSASTEATDATGNDHDPGSDLDLGTGSDALRGDAHIRALEAQLASAARMDEVIADAERRLRLLDAYLEEAVVRAVELSLRADAPVELTAGEAPDTDQGLRSLESGLESAVREMQLLRDALDEAERPDGIG